MPTKASQSLFPNRVVIDTNVWVSAVLSTKGAPAEVVSRVVGTLAHVFSDRTFGELETRIWKPKFDRYVTIETRHLVLRDIRSSANWADIRPEIEQETYSRDVQDDKFIHTALAGEALWLITGDDDLLVLRSASVHGIRILSPRQALEEPTFLSQLS